MSVEMDSNDCFKEIIAEIKRLPKLTDEAEKKALKEIGAVIKRNTINILNANRSMEDNMINYDGSRPYVHMADEVKASVQSDKMGVKRVVVRGGKMTAYKWHLVDDGIAYPNGEVFKGLNFTSQAMSDSQAEIDNYVDKLIEEVANGIGN